MGEIITEALLEMLYYEPLRQLFEQVFGARFLRLYKPSARREAWLGYDQAWVSTQVGQREFESRIQAAIENLAQDPNLFFVGYFLQFKCVDEVKSQHHREARNAGFAAPCYRVPLSMKPNKNTGRSQHETLRRLADAGIREVYYACPMLFCGDDLAEPDRLEKLRVVEVQSSPAGYLSNEAHYIFFRDTTDDSPSWFSEPTPGVAIGAAEWPRSRHVHFPAPMGPEGAVAWLAEVAAALGAGRSRDLFEAGPRLPEGMTLWTFSKEKPDGQPAPE